MGFSLRGSRTNAQHPFDLLCDSKDPKLIYVGASNHLQQESDMVWVLPTT